MAAPDWQGLLKWSTRNQTGEASGEEPKEISAEDRAWIEEALASVSVDVGKQLTTAKAILDSDESGSSESVKDKEDVLDGLVEIVENIDFARDLTKIGGMQTLMRLLADKHASIRWRAAEVIATCAQLNEPVQKEYLEADCITKLLVLLHDADTTCRQKALLALSCLIRNNDEGLDRFLTSGGIADLIRILGSDDPRNQRKAIQLLAYIAAEEPQEVPVKEAAAQLPDLLQSDDMDVREAVVTLVLRLVQQSQSYDVLSKDSSLLAAVDARRKALEKESSDDPGEELSNLRTLRQALEGSITAEPDAISTDPSSSPASHKVSKLSVPLLL